MGIAVITVAAGGLPVVETPFGTPVTEAANGRGVAVTKVVGKPGMPVVYETIGVAPPTASFTLATAVETTLSNNNLTATHATANSNVGVKGGSAASSGKYYFEVNHDILGGGDGIGLVTSAGTYGNVLAGTNCTSVFTSTGNISSNNAASGKNIGVIGAGVLIGVAVDLGARLAWFRKGAAGNWNGLVIGSENPAIGLGGVVVAPAVSMFAVVVFAASSGATYTANFGATAFAGTPPSGFGNWPP